MLANLPRRSAPDGTLERILALHASGSVYADAPVRGRILRLPLGDLARFGIPAAAAAAAVLATVGSPSGARSGTTAPALAMVRHAAVAESTADLRVVNDPALPAYALRFVAGDAP
jgi:hypothetical protein